MNANARQLTGSTVRERRIAAGMTQERLARDADCSTAYVRHLDRGYLPDPESAVFKRVVQVLDEQT